MNRVLRRALPLCALLLGASAAALAAGPVGPSPEDEVKELAKKISKELRENEEALAKLARGEKAEPKKVDIELPPSQKSDAESSGGT